NAPLAFLDKVTDFLPAQAALVVRQWSLGGQLAEFGRGVVSLEGILYFAAIIVVMLYLSMALIGRRHWSRRGGGMMAAHYLLRTLALLIIVFGVVYFSRPVRARTDVSSEKLSQLSDETRKFLSALETDRPVEIEAFISPETDVPEDFVTTRKNLVDVLGEIHALGGEQIRVTIHPTERDTPEATLAENRFRITPREIESQEGGVYSIKSVFMGVTVRSGIERETIPFVNRGTAVEYELLLAIRTVLQEKKPKLGVLKTGAPVFGQFNIRSMQTGRDWPLIAELRKQYDVVEIDASGPIQPDACKALLVVQPSMMQPQEMPHLLEAIRQGMPTAIFEDPLPIFEPSIPGTDIARRPPGGMMGGMQPSAPKANVQALWNLLGISFAPGTIIWQSYNPHPERRDFPQEFVFTEEGSGIDEPFSTDDPITSGMQQLFFAFPGALNKLNASVLEATPLVKTGPRSGTVRIDDYFIRGPRGQIMGQRPHPRRDATGENYIMAMHITGQLKQTEKPADDKDNPEKKKETKKKSPPASINVVVVADVDAITRDMFALREAGNRPGSGQSEFNFDNVPFVLNIIDSLAGVDHYLEVRKRRRHHYPLERIAAENEEAQRERDKLVEDSNKELAKMRKDENEYLSEQQAKLLAKFRKEIPDEREAARRALQVALANWQRQQAQEAQLEKKIRQKQNRIDMDLRQSEERIRNHYKLLAVLLPPILPLVLAVVFLISRRIREREGVARARLR
ncbi:MAG: Gldg family protein, partial [Pirellulales bacterium]|nr:Gldg family protein [Pirellulales bacterium]